MQPRSQALSQRINFLRGVAILLVFCYHSLLAIFGEYEFRRLAPSGLWFDFAHYVPGQIALNLLPTGMGAGVTMFMVLSGFLIHWNHLKSGTSFQVGPFLNRRFWRIYPPYLVALLVFSLLQGTGGTLNLLTHLTLTHNLFNSTFFAINPSLWSLALEVQLYLLYPVLLWLRRHLGMHRATLAVGLLALSTLGVCLALQSRSPALYLSPPAMWIIWAIGAYFGEQYYRQQRLFTGNFWHLVVAFLLLTLLKMTIISALLGRVLFALFFICVLDWYLPRTKSAPVPILALLGRFIAFIGICSYSLYLFHQPFLRPLIVYFSFGATNKISLGMGVLCAFGLLLSIAYCSYHLLELRSIEWGRRFYQRFGRR